jgi:hypothetical protein
MTTQSTMQNTPRVRIRKRPKSRPTAQVEYHRAEDLQPYANNARRHSPKQITQIKSSIEAFGFINPVIIDQNNEVIAGHGRLQAAIELKLNMVPVIPVGHLSDAEVRAYRLADNKIAENATWDEGLLRIEISALVELELADELSFDLGTLGFETAEVDLLLENESEAQPPEIVELPNGPTVARLGDIWQLGVHRITCGSALDETVIADLMAGDFATLVLTDPPYNVPVQGHVRGKGQVAHKEFAMASGEMTEEAFTSFLSKALGNAAAVATPGAVIMTFMDWRHMTELNNATTSVGLEQINLCVWVKTNAGMGSLYRSHHELCSICKIPGAAHQNNVQLGSLGRYRTNVWSYAGVNTFGKNRAADLVDHPTVKPIAMIEDAIRDVTRHGDIILDPFGGSGTTLLAAERCRRVARLVELDPQYVDVTIRRWQELTGREAFECSSGETWNERAAQIELGSNDLGEINDV